MVPGKLVSRGVRYLVSPFLTRSFGGTARTVLSPPAAAMATTPVSLEIPAGTYPGQEMAVEWGGVSYSITVPDGTQPGQEITVELPALEESAAAASSSGTTPVTLVIPDGTHPGQEMAVEWGGVSYSITVPDGAGPGQEITVELPSLDGSSGSSASGATEPAAARPLAQDEYELVGRRVSLKGLVAKAALNGRKGLVLDFYEDRGRLAVRIDGMQPDVAVKMDNLAELPEDDVYVPNEEPPEAPPAGIYFCGDRVYVEQHGHSGRLSGATAGHHGLLRLHLKAWGCTMHSGGEAQQVRFHRGAMAFQTEAAQDADFAAFDHPGGALRRLDVGGDDRRVRRGLRDVHGQHRRRRVQVRRRGELHPAGRLDGQGRGRLPRRQKGARSGACGITTLCISPTLRLPSGTPTRAHLFALACPPRLLLRGRCACPTWGW